MEQRGQPGDWGKDMGLDAEIASEAALQPLSLAALELLLASLDPRLEGFGEGPSCLDDARAFLARLANSGGQSGEKCLPTDTETMEQWIEIWRSAGGNRQTLRLLVQTLIAERLGTPPEGEEDSHASKRGGPSAS